MRGLAWLAVGLLVGLLAGCGLWEEAVPTPAPPPLATALPTRAALPTVPTPSGPPPPSATPDPTVVSEIFLSSGSALSFRYPNGWTIQDNSDATEILVSAQSPAGASAGGLFVVNLLNAEGALTTEELTALADTYLHNLFGSEFDALQPSYRVEGDAVIATAIRTSSTPPVQFEIRFAPRAPFYQVLLLIAPQTEWGQAAPLLDMMARSVAVNPEMGTFVPTPTVALARQSEGLTVQNASLYVAPTGSLYVVGEVANTSAQAYESVQVTVTLLDASGATLISRPWAPERRLLPAGERSPLVAIFNPPPTGWASASARVEGAPADFYARQLTTAFQTSQVISSTSAFAAYGLTGTVTNTGEDAQDVEVVGVLYNAAGKVLAISDTTLEQEVLRQGAQAPFQLTFFSKAEGEVARHEIWVEGLRLSAQE